MKHICEYAIAVLVFFVTNAELSFSQEWDASDYSEYKTASQYRDPYPDQQNFSNYPEFSWDKVARWSIIRSGRGFDTVDIRGFAEDYQLIVFEKANNQGLSNVEEGIKYASGRLKAVNPNIKSIFYWNTVVQYSGYAANAEFAPNAWEWSQHTTGADGEETYALIRDKYKMFNSNVPGLRKWWVKTAANMVNDPAVDGVFADKVGDNGGKAFFDENGQPSTNYIKMLDSLDKTMPEDALFLGNTIRNERWNGNREHMNYMEGSYLERWSFPYRSQYNSGQTETEAKAVNLQLMREMATKGKIVLWKLSPGYSSIAVPTVQSKENMIQYYKDAVEFPLALYLISAEKYTYMCYAGTVNADDATYLYLTDYIPELNRPIGEPLGPPTKDGYIYTRSFKYVDVWLNLETNECSLTWRDPIPDPSLTVTDFSTYPNELDVKTKSSFKIGTCFSPAEAGNTNVIWSSSDSSVATVDSTGIVTGVSAGFAVITGTSDDGGFTDQTWVTVSKDLIGEIPPGINIAPNGSATQSSTDYNGIASRAIDENIDGAYSKSSVTHTTSEANPWWQVDLGAEYTIGHIKLFGRTDECCASRLSDYTVRVFDANGDTTFSQIFASYPDPFEIMETGDVQGSTVQIRLNKTGALSLAEVQVYVDSVKLAGIEINSDSLTIKDGESYPLTAIYSPAHATNRKISWSSNNPSVATVNSEGVVTGTGVGDATITAKSEDGGFTAECFVSVTGVPAESITISPDIVTLDAGDTQQLITIFSPANTSNKTVTWESSNNNVASVDVNGLVSALAPGSATITATSNDGGYTAVCDLTVNSIQITGVSVYPKTATLYTGYTKQLTATVSPSNATNKHINWASDNIVVATVGPAGLVSANSAGTATITATTEDGGFTDECVFTISYPTGIDQVNSSDEAFNWKGATMEIYNIVGMLVYKQEVNRKTFEPNLKDLPGGTYIIIGKNDGTIIRKKITTQNYE